MWYRLQAVLQTFVSLAESGGGKYLHLAFQEWISLAAEYG
jgi:hypothetical protein